MIEEMVDDALTWQLRSAVVHVVLVLGFVMTGLLWLRSQDRRQQRRRRREAREHVDDDDDDDEKEFVWAGFLAGGVAMGAVCASVATQLGQLAGVSVADVTAVRDVLQGWPAWCVVLAAHFAPEAAGLFGRRGALSRVLEAVVWIVLALGLGRAFNWALRALLPGATLYEYVLQWLLLRPRVAALVRLLLLVFAIMPCHMWLRSALGRRPPGPALAAAALLLLLQMVPQ